MSARDYVVARARSQVNAPISYQLGAGGKDPNSASPGEQHGAWAYCDCSGFACWVLRENRFEPNDPFFGGFGGWLNTDSIAKDVITPNGHFTQAVNAKPGDVLVYPHRLEGHHGHIGIITEVNRQGAPMKVVHCSPRNGLRAIQETSAAIFTINGAVAGTHYTLVDDAGIN